MNQRIERRFLIHGEVQGVGYRFFAQLAAQRHHLTRCVKNLPDGRVEVLAQGTLPDLERYEQELREGPTFSSVEDGERLEPVGEDVYAEFRIID